MRRRDPRGAARRPRLTTRALVRFFTGVALAYSALHFAWSGIRQPFDHPNLGKFEEEAAPLREHLATGAPVHSRNPAQYGPVFLFVLHPLLRRPASDTTLAAWLYGLQLLCLAGSFAFTCGALRRRSAEAVALRGETAKRGSSQAPVADDVDASWRLIVAWLAIIWLNFTPLYTVLALKSVENWELLLIAFALYALSREWPWAAAVAIAAAGLIKVLPFAFLYYWLVTNRRTFAYACVATAALLLAGQLLYGSEMGIGYLPRIAMVSAGSSYGLDWHENISLKATLAKLFGHLALPTHDAALTSGYYVVLEGWRRTAATITGDVLVVATVAVLTWTWLRGGRRTFDRVAAEWSVLTVAVLILSPNTIFEYLTIALGAVSYAFVRLVSDRRRDVVAGAAFVVALVLIGGVVPRQVLNRLLFIDRLNQLTGFTHLMPSEAYEYYGFPVLGMVALLGCLVRLKPDTTRSG